MCSVALNSQLDICVSGGCDGVVVIHSLRAGRRLRVIRMAEAQIANVVAVSSVGAIYVHTRGDSALRKFSCNAELLHTTIPETEGDAERLSDRELPPSDSQTALHVSARET